MPKAGRYKVKIIKFDKSAWYGRMIGKEFTVLQSFFNRQWGAYMVDRATRKEYNTVGWILKANCWLIDTLHPEKSPSIYFPDDIADRKKADTLLEEIKRMGIFKEIWYLKSSHPYSEGLWIEFRDKEAALKDFHGIVLEHYVKGDAWDFIANDCQ